MKVKSIRFVSITLIFASLVLLEIFMFIKFQYGHHGLNRTLCKCKNLNNSGVKGRIVNGSVVDKEDLKWVASIFEDSTTNSTRAIFNFCTASVISFSYLLTAAHCFIKIKRINGTFVAEPYNISQFFVAVNFGHNMTKAYLPETPRRKIKKTYVHPAYQEKWVNEFVISIHDIAIFEVEEPLVLGDDVLPACLIEQDFTKFESNFIVAGYGSTSYNRSEEDSGKKLYLVEKNHLLMAIYKQSSDCREIQVNLDFNLNKICAFPQLLSDDWKGKRGYIYSGDSGGPLNYPILNSLYVAGITSIGVINKTTDFIRSNTNTTEIKRILFRPGKFTRVYYYLSWIDEIVGSNRCTTKNKFKLDYIKCTIFGSIFLVTCLFTSFLFYICEHKNIFKA